MADYDRWAVIPPGPDRDKKRERIVKILNSLLITSKAGIPIEKLQGNYKELEGERIPYKTIGCSTLEEFLDHGRDFCRIAYDREGNVLVRGIPNETNAHIAHMVSKQRNAGRKKPRAPPRRPMSRGSGQPWLVRPGGPRGGNVPFSQAPRRLGAINTQSRGRGGSGPRGGAQFRHAPMPSQQPRPANAANGWGAPPIQQHQARRSTSSNNSQQQQRNQQQSSSSSTEVDLKNKPKLQEFCQQHRLEPPEFKTAPFNKKFVSVVIVAGDRFQTFPKEYSTMEAAEAAAAKLALDSLSKSIGSQTVGPARDGPDDVPSKPKSSPSATQAASSRKPNSTQHPDNTSAGDNELKVIEERVLALVGERTNGVWSTQLDVEYKRKHSGQQLPANWARMLMEAGGSGRLRVDSPIEGRYIVTPVPKANNAAAASVKPPGSAGDIMQSRPKQQPTLAQFTQSAMIQPDFSSPPPPPPSHGKAPLSNGSGVTGSGTPSMESQRRPPNLNLPSDTEFWNVYITNVNSSTCVFLRLLGDEYSMQYENLVTEMEMHYFNENDFPSISQPQIGGIYALKYEGVWHRVEAVDISGVYVTVFFIDHGEKEVVTVDLLKELKDEFMQLPAQALSISLAGLEEFEHSPQALQVIQNELNGRSLVAEVHSHNGTNVSLLLIDTFTEQDIMINEKLMEQLSMPGLERPPSGAMTSPPPPLPVSSVGPLGGGTVTPTASLDRQMSPKNVAATNEAAAMAAAPMQQQPSPYSMGQMQNDLPDELASMKELAPPAVPAIGDFFDVNVTLAASPSNFTLQPWSQGGELEQLQVEMNSYYRDPSKRTPVTREALRKDKYFVGLHTDGYRYRVRVNSQIDEGTVAVRLVDYGDFSMIAVENLCLLSSRFRNLPMQAINASLADIIPTEGDWTAEDTVWFSNRVVDKQFVSVVKGLSTDEEEGMVRISVSLIDTTHPTVDVYVEKELVDSRKAVFLCV